MCSLACRYDNPIPTRFLAPIDCLKIPAQDSASSGKKPGKIYKKVKTVQIMQVLQYLAKNNIFFVFFGLGENKLASFL